MAEPEQRVGRKRFPYHGVIRNKAKRCIDPARDPTLMRVDVPRPGAGDVNVVAPVDLTNEALMCCSSS